MRRYNMRFTYEKYDTAQKDGFRNFREDIPEYITKNLRYPLRPYQEEAIGRYLYFKDHDATYPEQVLFNMATGSGKTLLMAAIILEKYHQGERNFIFFVNNDNILTKTRSNFITSSDNKYLFADKIVMNHQVVNIREVEDFSDSQEDSINIVFTTIQKLHQDLNTPRENRLSYEQFEDISVVLLADEAHHLNAGLNKADVAENTSWTTTIANIQQKAKKASVFEFTATIDLSNKDIATKYEKSLIFKYDLKEFRLDKYSKDVLFHLVDGDLKVRMLNAILISQYRKKIALKNGVNLKPLVMFKSEKIAENKENLNLFKELLDELTPEMILQQKSVIKLNNEKKINILQKALEYFEASDISLNDLIEELREDFRLERLMLIDGKNKSQEDLVLLNTLEQPINEIRAIFAVDMLNEGWDVLNLFDIVRLYDKRDGKQTAKGFIPGRTTNAEKQLIGRGARYYPFTLNNHQEEKYTRKFDDNENNELRVIEQLHYHAANNPKYISEMKMVLRTSGILDEENTVERELKLKDSFKNSRTYTNGLVWMNERLSYLEALEVRQESLFDTKFIPESIEVKLPTSSIRGFSVFEDDEITTLEEDLKNVTFKYGKVIGNNITRHAINQNKNYTFDKLQKAIIGLPSISVFMDDLKDIEVTVIGNIIDEKSLTPDQKLYIAQSLLTKMESSLIPMEEKFIGSDEFKPYPIHKVFEDNIIRKYSIQENSNSEFGISQKNAGSTQYFENIDELTWYAYDDNFGTSEEKLLVRSIKNLMTTLEKQWSDIYLLRNEKGVRIFNFSDGQAFEPDFLLFANDKKTGNISWQIFIEPKGSQFLDSNNTFKNSKEGWKEAFLNEITERSESKVLIDDDKYRIIGLPFFNEKNTKSQFVNTLKNVLPDPELE